MTLDHYKALRRAENEIRLEIVRALNEAGLDGWEKLRDLQDKETAQHAAWMQLSHEDRMTLAAEDTAQVNALIAKYAPKTAQEAAS